MGTRAVITFMDQNDEQYSIYQHWDGYPLTVLNNIRAAQAFAWNEPNWINGKQEGKRFEAGEFAAAYVRATKTKAGNIYLTEGPEKHGDLEFVYVYDGKTVKGTDVNRDAVIFHCDLRTAIDTMKTTGSNKPAL